MDRGPWTGSMDRVHGPGVSFFHQPLHFPFRPSPSPLREKWVAKATKVDILSSWERHGRWLMNFSSNT